MNEGKEINGRNKTMKHKVQLLIIASLAAILAVFTSCQDGSAEHFEGTAKSITVVVTERSSKVITAPGSSGDISHYKVTVENKAENYTRESDYLSKGSVYNVTNVPAGIWTATVEAYVHFESDEVPFLVSSGTETAYFPEGISSITKEGTGYKITSGSDSDSLTSASGQILAGGNAVSYTIADNTITLTSSSLDNLVISLNVETDAGYVKVAEATSEEVRVGADESVTIPVTLDTLIDALSGDITVTLDMPAELDDENDTFYYTYTIAGTGQRADYSYMLETPAQGTVNAEGNGTLIIDADAISPQLNQGAYLLTVTVFDKATEAESDVARKGVEIMRLLPGIASEGSINLDTDIGYPSGSLVDAEISIVDKIGDKLDFGEASYDNTNDVLTITVDYNTVSTSTPVDVYIDGVKSNPSASTSGTSKTFRFSTFPDGYHLVTFVLDEADTQLGVESLTVQINTPIEGSIELVNHFRYADNGDGTCTITGEDPNNPLPSHVNLEIPSEIKGLKVTAIGSSAFQDNSFTGDLIIPNSVKTIGSQAFYGSGFTGTLTLPEGLKAIRRDAFYNCGFTGNLVIPDSVTEISNNAFRGNSFTGTLTLGKNLQTIGESAFGGNSFTGSLVVPSSVTEIARSAFADNSFTGTLTLPEGLQTIGYFAFANNDFTGDLVIPDSVTSIDDYAFQYNAFTGSLIIPSGVTEIGEYAFYSCAFTGTLTLPEGLQVIGSSAFRDNSFTGTLTLPEGLQVIGSSAFNNNSFTGDLIIPSSVKTIGYSAFEGNSFTGSLIVPSSVTEIARSAFYYNNFTGTLTLPEGLQTIRADAFADNSFTGDLIIPTTVTTIDSSAFSYAGFTGNLVIPDSVTEIARSAFSGCTFTAIYCEAESQPLDWNSSWHGGSGSSLFWGISAEEYQNIIAGNVKPVISNGPITITETKTSVDITIQGYTIENLTAKNFMLSTNGIDYSPVSEVVGSDNGHYEVTIGAGSPGGPPTPFTCYLYLTGAGDLQDSDPITISNTTA